MHHWIGQESTEDYGTYGYNVLQRRVKKFRFPLAPSLSSKTLLECVINGHSNSLRNQGAASMSTENHTTF